jgi:hypothetical protein
MHVKSTLISAAIIISSTTVLGSVLVQAQDRVTSEGQRLHQLCDGGDKRACVRYGMMFNENRARHDEWRRSHPEFLWSSLCQHALVRVPNHSAMRNGYAAPGRRLRAEGLILEGGDVRTLDRHPGAAILPPSPVSVVPALFAQRPVRNARNAVAKRASVGQPLSRTQMRKLISIS